MGNGNSHIDDDEPEGNSALDIHLDLLVMAYLRASEVSMDWHPRSGIKLSIGRNNSNRKVIPYYVWYHTQNIMKALYGKFMKSWATLGSNEPIVCSRHNIGGMGCNYKFKNLFLGVWCVIEYRHHSTHQHFNYSPYQLWG